MERALLDRPPNYDHDYDGRPPVGWHDDDPLLERLIRFHPEMIPAELAAKIKADRGRVTILASASAEPAASLS
jgi:hypothetical protein